MTGQHGDEQKGGNTANLLQAWQFSHNWREIDATGASMEPGWIPGPNDRFMKNIEVVSRKQGDPDFLRPTADGVLATGGVGIAEKSLPLPTYVGAIPPKGGKEWDWSITWNALVGKKQ